jgi:hypothetical protein
MAYKSKSFIVVIISLFIVSPILFAQGGRIDEIQNVLSRFKQYRFGAVNVYEITNSADIKEIMDAKKSAADGGGDIKKGEELLESITPEVQNLIKEGVLSEKTLSAIQQDIFIQGYDIPEQDVFKEIYNYYISTLINTGPQLDMKVYVVTTQPEKVGDLPSDIIATILIEKPFEEMTSDLKDNLEFVDPSMIYSYRMMKAEDIDRGKYGYENMYELIYSYFIQGNYTNKTMQARGIGTDIRYFSEQVGVSSPLIDYSFRGVQDSDIQTFKRISYGEPQSYYGKDMELLVSADHIRWTKYPMYFLERRGKLQLDSLGNPIVDTRRANNSELPQIGFELKYGADDINMPSFVSDRMNFSVLWSKVKLGVILPTSGWAGLQEDLFNIDRRLTHGGFGITGEFDFALPIIPKSDVFRLSFGYTFGDAVAAPYGSESIGNAINDAIGNNPQLIQSLVNDSRNVDYLLRYNTTLHYTFGLDIDEDYLLRFGIGGSIYTMEEWKHDITRDDLNIPNGSMFSNNSTEAVGGISGKVDFMVRNTTTPYGASMNYFDESLNLNLFVQFPVIENMLYLKLKANGIVYLRENLRPWENGSYFMPMANIIYVF